MSDDGHQFHFDPDTYDALMTSDVPAYGRLQRAVAEACGASGSGVGQRLLELGTGTGETAVHVLAARPGAELVGVDASEAMLSRARVRLPEASLSVARLQDPLPAGPFDVVFSALAVHHLDAREKASLFARVAEVVAAGGRFVLGDLIVPKDPADVVTPIDGVFDVPSSLDEQLEWLGDAGFVDVSAPWVERDLAVMVGVK
jgi:cyclopropane fatty-acyl-phospholipid synthase-like methyltransferase